MRWIAVCAALCLAGCAAKHPAGRAQHDDLVLEEEPEDRQPWEAEFIPLSASAVGDRSELPRLAVARHGEVVCNNVDVDGLRYRWEPDEPPRWDREVRPGMLGFDLSSRFRQRACGDPRLAFALAPGVRYTRVGSEHRFRAATRGTVALIINRWAVRTWDIGGRFTEHVYPWQLQLEVGCAGDHAVVHAVVWAAMGDFSDPRRPPGCHVQNSPDPVADNLDVRDRELFHLDLERGTTRAIELRRPIP